LSIKAWASYVNYTRANDNFNNNKENKTIDTPKLMKCFCAVQDKILTHQRVEIITNPAIKFENTDQTQNTGEFIPVSKQEEIKKSFQKLIDKKQEIVDIRIFGKADATGPESRQKPESQIINSTTALLQR